jgi:hypothetical protein
MTSICSTDIVCYLGILQVRAKKGDKVPSKTAFIHPYLAHKMVYERVKEKT